MLLHIRNQFAKHSWTLSVLANVTEIGVNIYRDYYQTQIKAKAEQCTVCMYERI